MAPASAIGAVREHFAKSVHRLALLPAHLIRVHLVPGCAEPVNDFETVTITIY